MEKSPFEQMKFEIQENLISLICQSEDVDTSLIRFLKPEERISEDEIWEKYDTVYSIMIRYEYPKQSKYPKISSSICKDFTELDNSPYGKVQNAIILHLEPTLLPKFIFWGRSAAKEVYQYFKEYEYYLRDIRFDFFIENESKTSFFVPNLPLESIHISYKPRSKEFVSTDDFVNFKLHVANQLKDPNFLSWNNK